jgi:N-acetylmuramoyl-L-alanine amidase
MNFKKISFFFLITFLLYCIAFCKEIKPKLPWERLKKYHDTLTLQEFQNLVAHIYSPDGSLYEYLDMTPNYIDIYNDIKKTKPSLFRLHLAKKDASKKSVRVPFKNAFQLSNSREKPLEGLRIILDPGHIGGSYAVMEQRIFKVKDRSPITEADLNLKTARRLKKNLESFGAKVYLTKEELKPVTKARPQDFKKEAEKNLASQKITQKNSAYAALLKKEMERLFYRTSEIEARSELVNHIKPDFTLCIHFNAAPGTLENPLTKDNRLVIFINGSYEKGEIIDEEQKYKLFSKLLEGSHEIELGLASEIAHEMSRQTELPPVLYPPSPSYIKMDQTPYVYARNLSANRLFQGPVIYLEPYYQNNLLVYERALTGDYEGEKVIMGKPYRSIFREYADSVSDGIVKYFTQKNQS